MGAKEIPPAEESEERESNVEADKAETEKERERARLVLAAREKAESLLREALRERESGHTKEDFELQRQAYRIFLALDKLGVELPPVTKDTAERQGKKGDIAGFSVESSAEDFLRQEVGDARREEAEAA